MKRRRPSPTRSGAAVEPAAPLAPLVERATWLLLLALVVLVPLLVLPGQREAFRQPKLIASGLLGMAAATLLLAGATLGMGRLAQARLPGRAAIALAPYLAVATLSWFTTDHPAHVRDALLSLWTVALPLAVLALGLSRQALERLLHATVLPGVLLALVGLGQALDLFQPFAFVASQPLGRERITSLSGNPADLGSFLVVAILACAASSIDPARRQPRHLVALLVLVAGLLATRTLASLGALGVGLMVLVGIQPLRQRRLWLPIAGLAAATLAIGIGWPPLRERLGDKVAALRHGDLNELLSGRLDGWRAALAMAREQPLAGVGHGAFTTEFGATRLALIDEGVPFYRGHRFPTFANAHSEPLEILAETGLPGLLAALWFLALLLPLARERLRQGQRLAPACLAAIGLLCLVDFPLRIAMTAWIAALASAVVFAVEDT